MIRVNRLNGYEIVVNAELIELIESIPDTAICLATGTKIIVNNSVDEVVEKIMEYRKKVYASGKPPAELLLKTYTKEA